MFLPPGTSLCKVLSLLPIDFLSLKFENLEAVRADLGLGFLHNRNLLRSERIEPEPRTLRTEEATLMVAGFPVSKLVRDMISSSNNCASPYLQTLGVQISLLQTLGVQISLLHSTVNPVTLKCKSQLMSSTSSTSILI